MAATIEYEKCNGCGDCFTVCPIDVISPHYGKAMIDTKRCVDCGVCAGACPADAIFFESWKS